MNMTVSGQVVKVLGVFAQIIVIIFAITAAMLLMQFCVAGLIGGKNPFVISQVKLFMPPAPVMAQRSHDRGRRRYALSYTIP